MRASLSQCCKPFESSVRAWSLLFVDEQLIEHRRFSCRIALKHEYIVPKNR
jgi:hypothetical protein